MMCTTPVSVYGYVHMYARFLQRPEQGIKSPGAGLTGHCNLSDVGAENKTRVL